ncbi:uncharacterized protein TNCV_2826201 [Trichonephila clavipes]|nr:uncharacterized protein TNCV_2826201 [Trichonephila clavipes]
MSRQRNILEFMAWPLIGRLDSGLAEKTVADAVGVERSVIARLWNQFHETGHIRRQLGQLVQEPARNINHGYRWKEPHTGTPMSGAERARRFRERRKADAARNFSAAANLASTSTTGIPVLMDVTNEQTIDISIGSATELRDLNISRSEAMQNHWRSVDKRFKTVFEANPFGLSCSVCDRLWFERDLKKVKHRNSSFLQTKLPDENVTEFRLCSTCSKSIDANKIPTLSRSNGFRYPPKPSGLPLLDPISIRLISPRLPFMPIRRLRYEGNYGIVGQVINVPVDVNNMVQSNYRGG